MPLDFLKIKDLKEIEKKAKGIFEGQIKGVPNREKIGF